MWAGIPPEFYDWKPDADAMTLIELVRHILESEYIYRKIIEGRGVLNADFKSAWEDRPFTNIEDELAFAQPYREQYLDMIRTTPEQDLTAIEIVRAERGQRRKLGDYLLRIAYHEAIHTGNILSYLRMLGVNRPEIWD